MARARELAADLDVENRARQGIEEKILNQAVAMVEAWSDLAERRSVVLASSEWHPGVIGIVASRLVERFHRPTFLIALDGGKGKGSGRSPKVFHLYDGLKACADLLDGYGGHRQAAGLSIQAERVPALAERFESVARARLQAEDLIPQTEVDAELDLCELDGQTMAEVRRLEPYGQGNPEPIFLARAAQIVAGRVVGGNPLLGKPGHLKLVLRSSRGGRPVDAIGFGMGNVPVSPGSQVSILYTPEINVWNGNATLQVRLRDLKITD
jgi:single-stranded-DNA-specific exonuclease